MKLIILNLYNFLNSKTYNQLVLTNKTNTNKTNTMETNTMETNQIGQVIDITTLGCREMDLKDLHKLVQQNYLYRAATWGFRNATAYKNKVYRFTVSGHHHKGHVYIVLDWMDLFKVYYTSNRGLIKKIESEIYFDDLVERLDEAIEKIAIYQR